MRPKVAELLEKLEAAIEKLPDTTPQLVGDSRSTEGVDTTQATG